MLYKIEARAEPSLQMALAAPLIATGLTIVISSIFFLTLGLNPFLTLYTFLCRTSDHDERCIGMAAQGLTADPDRVRACRSGSGPMSGISGPKVS